jgi:hypothetical protein
MGAAAGDKRSLAIAISGLLADHSHDGRVREASPLASEPWTLNESLGDPILTVALSWVPIYPKMESAEWSDMPCRR